MVEFGTETILFIGLLILVIILLAVVVFMIKSMFSQDRRRPKVYPTHLTKQVEESPSVSVATKQLELPELLEPISDIEHKHFKEYEDTKGFNITKDKRSRLSIGFWTDWWHNRRNPHKTFLINMELLNGMHLSFQVVEKDEGFKYRNKLYLFDNESKYYNLDAKMWCYDYHEQFSLPIQRIINVSEIQSAIQSSKVTEMEHATNPATLERFAVSKIAEGIMRGAQMDDFFNFLRLILIIIVVGVYIHFILFVFKSGILNQVTGIV